MLHMFWIFPPLFPFVGILCCYANISYRCIKPYVKDLCKLNDNMIKCFVGIIMISIISRITFDYIFLTLSSYPCLGTLVPHLRSRVIHRGCRPFFIHVLAITLALLVHAWDASSIHCVSLGSIFGKSMKICLLVFVFGVELQILHLGFRSSTALISFPHVSH